jgi:hypothetical protein
MAPWAIRDQERSDPPGRRRSTKAPRVRRDQARSNLPWRARRIQPMAELLAPAMFNFGRRVIVVGFPFVASAGILDLWGTRGYPQFLNSVHNFYPNSVLNFLFFSSLLCFLNPYSVNGFF